MIDQGENLQNRLSFISIEILKMLSDSNSAERFLSKHVPAIYNSS